MPENKLEFSRNLYERTIDWYKNADSKAQIILTLNGALISFLAASIFKNPDELFKIIRKFNGFTWFCLFAMGVCIAGSVTFAIKCLWSRISTSVEGDAESKDRSIIDEMAFFGTIRRLKLDDFRNQLPQMNENAEIKALGTQIYLLSRNVNEKHLAVNLSFVLIGGALIFFLLGGISYLLSVMYQFT